MYPSQPSVYLIAYRWSEPSELHNDTEAEGCTINLPAIRGASGWVAGIECVKRGLGETVRMAGEAWDIIEMFRPLVIEVVEQSDEAEESNVQG